MTQDERKEIEDVAWNLRDLCGDIDVALDPDEPVDLDEFLEGLRTALARYSDRLYSVVQP